MPDSSNNNNNNNNNTRQENAQQQQQKIIESQLEQIKDLTQRLEFAQDTNREYQDMRAAFGSNPGMTWAEAQNIILSRQNALIETERQQREYERRSQREAEELSNWHVSKHSSRHCYC